MPHFFKNASVDIIDRGVFIFDARIKSDSDVDKGSDACNLIKMVRVLVIRFSSLGDIIMTLPSLEHLLSQGAEVHVLTKQSYLPLLKTFSSRVIIHAISDHATLTELLRELRKLKLLGLNQVYDLHRNLRSMVSVLYLGVHFKRIKKYRIKEALLYLVRRRIFRSVGFSPIDRAGSALRLVGGEKAPNRKILSNLPPRVAVLEDWQTKWAREYVCIAMESKWPQKEWSASKFREVASALDSDKVGVVWIGIRALEAGFAGEKHLDLTGKLEIGEVAAVLEGARALICNDSGLMHLAEAVSVPVVAVFGPTSDELGFAPRLKASQIAEIDLWCRPCSKTGRGCIRPIARRKCLTNLKSDDVIMRVRKVIAGEMAEKGVPG